MDRFTGSAHDGGWSPRNVGAPVLGPVPSDSWADAFPYPAFLDEPGADPGRADYGEQTAGRFRLFAGDLGAAGFEAAGLDAAGLDLGTTGMGTTGMGAAGLGAAGMCEAAIDAAAIDAAGIDFAGFPGGTAEELAPAVLRAELRVRRVEMLVGGLSRHRATEAQIHADRALDIRRIAVLLGAESENPIERVQARSLASAEVAAELSLPPRAARALVAECLALTEPEAAPVLTALVEGQLDRPRAQAILRAAVGVPAVTTLDFMVRAVALTTAGGDDGALASLPALQRSLRRMAQKYSSTAFEERARVAREHRRVDIEPADDGMCHLSAWLPLEEGAAIDTRLQAIARSQPADDPRTVGQRRLDAFSALLLAPMGEQATGSGSSNCLGGAAGTAGSMGPRSGVRTEIVVTVPHTTLLPARESSATGAIGTAGPAGGRSSADPARIGPASGRPQDEPAEVLGYGLIPASAARELAARASTWMRAVIDPYDGTPLALGRTRYTPPPVLRRYLAQRDAGCRFPACDRPHPHTEADHTLEWTRGGATEPANLALLCPEHHRLKTLGHWTATQSRAGGRITWTSPLGRTYSTTPGDPKPPPSPSPPPPPPF